jgi:glutathione S-transferase
MQNETALPLVGVPGSPYSRKLRAVLRYRRIPFHWINQGSPEAAPLPRPKVSLLPQLILDGQARTDTTPLIRELEKRVPGQRSVVPEDPVLGLVDALIEDYGDEWLTKAMFHYRWAFDADIAKAQTILPRCVAMAQSDEALAAAGKEFAQRQIDRLSVVGSNATTGPVIEDSYGRFLDLFENHLRTHRFVLGGRPGSSDFALYGQLTQLALFDPTAVAKSLERGPRVCAWADLVEDLSGLEPEAGDWFDRDALPATLRALLEEIGRVYVPFLLANAEALAVDAEQVECEIDGRRWVQRPFPYQAKCLKWLRDDYARLSVADRSAVDDILVGTGCERLFQQDAVRA